MTNQYRVLTTLRASGMGLLLLLSAAGPNAVLAQCTSDTCTTCSQPALGANEDWDGIPDTLEYDLAHRFFPAILMQNSNVDFWETYFYSGKAIPYSVTAYQLGSGLCAEAYKCLEIRYGIAYFSDAGDQGFPGHLGDSEFYAALVMRNSSWPVAQGDSSQWQMIRDFTAAHWGDTWGAESSRYGAYGYCPGTCSRFNNDEISCSQSFGCAFMQGQCLGGMSGTGPNYYPCSSYSDGYSCSAAGGSCQWQPSRCLQNLFCYSGSPSSTFMTLYASEKKHGTYHSDGECDSGGFFGADNCPDSYLINLRDYKGNLLQNVGNSSTASSSDIYIQHPDRCQLYNVWGGLKFGSNETTDYRHHFTVGLSWMLPPTATSGCGEASCVPAQGTYISHFTGAACTGTESYYLPYDGYAYQCRPWNGIGQCGTIHRTVTNRSYRYNGSCYDAWPSGNTLSDFVTVYR